MKLYITAAIDVEVGKSEAIDLRKGTGAARILVGVLRTLEALGATVASAEVKTSTEKLSYNKKEN